MFDELVSGLVNATDAELDEFIRAQESARRSIETRLAAAIAVANARALGENDGHRSTKAYLKATLNWSDGECARFRGAARTVDAHPAIGAAWLEGRIGSSQVAELSRTRSNRRAGERFAEFVPLFVEQAETLPLNEFKVVLQRFVHLAAGDCTIDEREAIERRAATVAEVGGELYLRASGGHSLATAEFIEVLQRFENAEFRRDLAARDAAEAAGKELRPMRSGPQRRFDALLAMARAAARRGPRATNDADADDAVADDAVGSAPLVSVVTDQRTMSWICAHSGLGAATNLAGESIDPFTGLPLAVGALDDLLGDPATFLQRRCETTTGQPLRPTDVLRAMLSGEIRRVVLGAKGRVVDLGRSSRVFTGAARDAARLLTVSCDHPGCDLHAAWCQVDHSTEWHQDGTTDQDNAAILCRAHNTDKHRRRRRTRRATDGRIHTFRPDGTIMLPVGCRPPRLDDPDDPTGLADLDSLADSERCLVEAARHRLALLR